MTWQPTHTVPDGGLSVWTTPDGRAAPTQQLGAGTPVQVTETNGGWSRVLCDNGFTGWVDHLKLAAAGPAPAPASLTTPVPVAGPPGGAPTVWVGKRIIAAVILVGAVLVVLVYVFLAHPADDNNTRSSASGSDTDIATTDIALHVPGGWTKSPDGTEAAENADDLGADSPSGAVVRAQVIAPDADTSDLLTGLTDGLEGDDLEFDDAASTTVDGFDAVTITVHGNGRVRSLLTVHPPGAATVLFRLDAPEDRFDDLRSQLESVPGVAPH